MVFLRSGISYSKSSDLQRNFEFPCRLTGTASMTKSTLDKSLMFEVGLRRCRANAASSFVILSLATSFSSNLSVVGKYACRTQSLDVAYRRISSLFLEPIESYQPG